MNLDIALVCRLLFNDSLHPFHDLKPHQNYTSEQWNKKLNWYIKWELKQQSEKNGLNPFLHIFPVQVLKYTSSRFGSGISFLCNRREQSDLFTQPPPLSPLTAEATDVKNASPKIHSPLFPRTWCPCQISSASARRQFSIVPISKPSGNAFADSAEQGQIKHCSRLFCSAGRMCLWN